LIVALICVHYAVADTYYMTLSYGGDYTCEVCGTANYSYTGSPHWNYGERAFEDPLPKGAVLNSISVETTQVYWCGGNPYVEIEYYLNDDYINYASSGDPNQCSCGQCAPIVTAESSYYQDGLPSYNYGGENEFTTYLVSGTSIGIATLTIIFEYTQNTPSGSNVTAVIDYQGCGPCSLCDSNDYSLSNGAADCGVGVWDEGFSHFLDPVPKGSIVTQITVVTASVFWCSPPVSVTFLVANQTVGTSPTINVNRCYCNECAPSVTISSGVYPSGFPGYQYGDVNDFQAIVNQGVFGIQYLELVLTYSSS